MFAGHLLHELSNDGAREQFQAFVHEFILPAMVASAKVWNQNDSDMVYGIYPDAERRDRFPIRVISYQNLIRLVWD